MMPAFYVSRAPSAFRFVANPAAQAVKPTVSADTGNTIDIMNPQQNPKAPLLLSGTGQQYATGGIVSRKTLIWGGVAVVALGTIFYFATRK